MSIRLAVLAAAAILSACSQPTAKAKNAVEAQAIQVDEPPAQLVAAWKEAVNICRGSLDDGPEVDRACSKEDQALDALLAAGWCFGKQGQAKVDEDWHRCGPDSYRGSSREVQHPKAPEAVVVGGLTSPAVLNFETGLVVPIGMSMAEFQRQAPGSECAGSADLTYCDMGRPLTCPSGPACSEVSYSFRGDRMDGFVAKYGAAEWRQLLQATEAKYGKPRVHAVDTPELPLKSRTFIWTFDHGDLGFTEWSGTDVYGEPLRSPYSVTFGPPGSAPAPSSN